MKLLMMLVALAACSESKGNPFDHTAKIPEAAKPVEPAAPAVSAFMVRGRSELAKITEFKDAMCKCRDRACATKVLDAHIAWTDAQPPDRTTPGPGELDEIKRLMKVQFDEQQVCMEKALTPKMSAYKVKALEGAKRLTALKDAMCACTQGDGECVGKVMVAQKEYADESAANPNKEKPGPGEKDEMMALLNAVVAEHKKCMTHALMLEK